MKKAFSMVELIMAIVILGILSAVAIPRLYIGRDEALLEKTKVQIQTIRSGIAIFYSDSLLRANPGYPKKLEKDGVSNDMLFSAVMPLNGIKAVKKGDGWSKEADEYFFTLGKQGAVFIYDNKSGNFSCIKGDLCDELD
ncbi:type II secretion system protein [Campylobacter mucosalis]|uniref:type II secretion system protein n=1 Tax=Campylobacter mucosalis TaxID=202 RepID=UPI0014707895|nr:type II secretion system protein [Campylobacter mucosalis]